MKKSAKFVFVISFAIFILSACGGQPTYSLESADYEPTDGTNVELQVEAEESKLEIEAKIDLLMIDTGQ